MWSERGLPILTYHAIDDGGSVLSTPPRVFAAQMALLREQGVRTVTLAEAAAGLRGGARPAKAVAITFDDGFASVGTHAVPVLRRHGFTATVFLVSDYCGRTNDWPTQPPDVARQPLLDWAQIAAMAAAGIDFGAHTLTHPDLTALPRREAEHEILASKRAIEERLRRPVTAFAYPYGAVDATARAIVAGAFAIGCGTRLAFASPGGDPHVVDRIDAYYLRDLRLFRRLFAFETWLYLSARRCLRAVRAAGRSATVPLPGAAT